MATEISPAPQLDNGVMDAHVHENGEGEDTSQVEKVASPVKSTPEPPEIIKPLAAADPEPVEEPEPEPELESEPVEAKETDNQSEAEKPAEPEPEPEEESEEPEPEEPETAPAEDEKPVDEEEAPMDTDEKKDEEEQEAETPEEPEADAEPAKEEPEAPAAKPAAKSHKKSPSKSPAKPKASPAKKETPKKERKESGEDGTPALEQPLERSSKRERTAVQRFTTETYTPTHKEVEIPEGSGTKLANIPFIEHMITKTTAEEMKTLHRICFGKQGTAKEIKGNLRKFNGYAFAMGTPDYEKKKKQIDGYKQKDLKKVCEILGLERTHTKEKLVDEIMDFVMKPEDKGKNLPKPAPRGAKRKRSSTGSKKGKKSKEANTSAAPESDEGKDSDEEEEEKHPEPPAKRGRPKSTSSTPAKAKKAATPKKKTADSLDDRIRNAVKDLLKNADLEKVTMKEMCKKVYDKFDEDLSSKKDFIKATVKQIISSQ